MGKLKVRMVMVKLFTISLQSSFSKGQNKEDVVNILILYEGLIHLSCVTRKPVSTFSIKIQVWGGFHLVPMTVPEIV